MIHIDLWTVFCAFLMLMMIVFTVKPNVLGLAFCSIAVLILNFTVSEDVALIGLITPFVAFSLLTAILIHFCKKYEDGNKQGSYKRYTEMGLVSSEGVVIGQYDTIVGRAVSKLTGKICEEKKRAAIDWLDKQGMHPIPLYLRDNSSNHILIDGSAQYSRSDRFIIPTLLDGWASSVVVHDIKGEYWETTAGYRKSIGNVVIKFEPTTTDDTSACWNPLDEIPIGTPDERFVTDTLSSALVRMGKTEHSDFTDKASSVLAEIILHLKYAYSAYSQTVSLYDVATYMKNNTVGMVDEAGNPVYEYLSFDGVVYDSPLEYTARVQKVVDHTLHEIVLIPDDEENHILSLINAALEDYLDPILAHHTETSDFCIDDLMDYRLPISLYLVSRQSDRSCPSPIFRIFLEMLGIFGGDKVKWGYRHRCLLLMDECSSLGCLNIFSSGLPHIALYGIKAVLFGELVPICKFYYGLKTDMQVVGIIGEDNKYAIIKDDTSVYISGVKYQESHHFLSRMYEAPEKSDLIHGNST